MYLAITPANFLDETLVLSDTSAHLITVGYFIAQGGPDARLPDRLFDLVEGTVAHGRGGMMVDYGGGAVANTFDQWYLGRQADIFFRERHV
jgi:hypothetical protein